MLELFSGAKKNSRGNPRRICFFLCDRVRLFVWDAHVNHESDGHASHQRKKIELFFCPPASMSGSHQD